MLDQIANYLEHQRGVLIKLRVLISILPMPTKKWDAEVSFLTDCNQQFRQQVEDLKVTGTRLRVQGRMDLDRSSL